MTASHSHGHFCPLNFPGYLARELQILNQQHTSDAKPPSVPDNFKNVFDWKTSDLPRKPKLVVGEKNVHQDTLGFLATSLLFLKRYFHLASAWKCCL